MDTDFKSGAETSSVDDLPNNADLDNQEPRNLPMALSIKDWETEQLARRLVERTGETIAAANRRTLEEGLKRTGSGGHKAALLDTSIIVASELRYGCAKKGSAKLQERVEQVLAVIPVLPLEAPADVEYGAIRAELERRGQLIGHNDLLIAAHACVLGTTLVTNIGEFSRIETWTVENWLG